MGVQEIRAIHAATESRARQVVDEARSAFTQLDAHLARSRASLVSLAGGLFATPRESPIRIGDVPAEKLDKRYEVVIIGGGPAGVAGALQAACLGRRALIVDMPKMEPNEDGLDISFGGPTGLFSKALRDAGKSLKVESLRSVGMDDDVIWQQVRNMCKRLASANAQHQVKTLTEFKVDYLQAHATIISSNHVLAKRTGSDDHHIITTDNVLVASGSKPLAPPNIPFDGTRVFDSDTINNLAFLPSSVVIVGAGIIAIEFAKIFRKLGCAVYVLVRGTATAALERIMIDRDVAAKLLDALRNDGVQIFEDTEVLTYTVPPNREQPMTLELKSQAKDAPSVLECDIYLAAIGRVPKTKGFGLEKVGVNIAKFGHIEVNDSFQTSVPGIYAVGDSIGRPALASTGVEQAKNAVLSMFDEGEAGPRDAPFPVGMWTTPEVGYYGFTKEVAEKNGLDVEEGIAPYTACLRGRVFAPEGLLKLVFKKSDGVIVGVHAIGYDACELTHFGMGLVQKGTSIFAVMSMLFTAVTFHELFKEAATDGNSKLAFGVQWHSILKAIGEGLKTPDGIVPESVLRAKFNEGNKSGSGALDKFELRTVCESLGVNLKRGMANNIIRLADSDGNGTLDWDEFLAICNHATGSGKPVVQDQGDLALVINSLERLITPSGIIGVVDAVQLEKRYELVVVGGGPAGVAGAIRGALLGKRVLIVDKPKAPVLPSGLDVSFGGPTGLFSKALRDAGKAINVKSLRTQGLDDDVIWHQVQNLCQRLSSMNAEHQVKTLAKFKVDYLQATACLEGANELTVTMTSNNGGFYDREQYKVATDNILIATGSKPLRPAEIPFDGLHIHDSDTINTLSFLPKCVAIVGAGIIAIEYAKIFRKLGAEVFMLVRGSATAALERVGIDVDVSAKLLQALRQDNVKIYEQTGVSNYDVRPSRAMPVHLKLTGNANVPGTLDCDVFLAAVGRSPHVKGCGLEAVGVKIGKWGQVEVDNQYQTCVPSIYAVGDSIGRPSLASTGVNQAMGAVLAMFDEGAVDEDVPFPVGMWTVPEVGYFGLTKAAAEKKGLDVEEGVVPYTACLRGRVFAPDGLLKLVFKKRDGVIIGIHAIGADACELIHFGMDLVLQNATIFMVMDTLFTAVTFHELFKEAAIDGNSKLAFGMQWHRIIAAMREGLADHLVRTEQLQAEFNLIDSDGSGELNAEELQQVFEKLGRHVPKGMVKNMIRLADDNGNGTIDWPEFVRVIAHAAEGSKEKAGECSTPDKEKPDRSQ